MENNSKKMGDGLVWFLLLLVMVGVAVMIWMGTKNIAQAPGENTMTITPTPTETMTQTITPTQKVTPVDNSVIDLKLKEINTGGQEIDSSLKDEPVNIQ